MISSTKRYGTHLVLLYLTNLLYTTVASPVSETKLIHTRAVSNTSKAGLAWPNGGYVDIRQYEPPGKISWYYTWSVWPISSKQDLEFVPMLWGNRSLEEFNSKINSTLENTQPKIKAVLGMNEPEQAGQSNMTAQEGAAMWKENMEPLRAQGVRLGSPVVSSAPQGKVWMSDFFAACNGSCTVDFIALHWYGTDASAFIAYLWDYYYAFNKTIWVTEWACQNYVDAKKQCSADDVIKFMNITQQFMDNATWVERYAWFGAMKDMQGVNQYNSLMDKNGKINPLGKMYSGAVDGATLLNGTATLSGGSAEVMPFSPSSLFWSTLILVGLQTAMFLL